MEKFYAGFPEPGWLWMNADQRPPVPAGVGGFVSHWRLTRRPRTSPYPKATIRWALDSGTFGAADTGRALPSPEQYVADVWRFDKEIGMLDWAAPQDRMCEPWMLKKTGWTVEDNQRHTIDNFWRLFNLWWDRHDADMAARWEQPYRTDPEERLEYADTVPFMPVLQGWHPDDYRRHVDMYYAAGIKLEDFQLVGLGSVCRRGTLKPIQDLVRELSGFLDLHGFGLKTEGVEALGPVLGSADSMAWCLGARKRGGECRHGLVKLETNCPAYALEWAGEVWGGAGAHIPWHVTNGRGEFLPDQCRWTGGRPERWASHPEQLALDLPGVDAA